MDADWRDIIGQELARTEVHGECRCSMSLKLKSLIMTEYLSSCLGSSVAIYDNA